MLCWKYLVRQRPKRTPTVQLASEISNLYFFIVYNIQQQRILLCLEYRFGILYIRFIKGKSWFVYYIVGLMNRPNTSVSLFFSYSDFVFQTRMWCRGEFEILLKKNKRFQGHLISVEKKYCSTFLPTLEQQPSIKHEKVLTHPPSWNIYFQYLTEKLTPLEYSNSIYLWKFNFSLKLLQTRNKFNHRKQSTNYF